MSESYDLTNVEIWTDGSGTQHAPGGWAFILRCQRSNGSWVEKEVRGGALDCTSQRMEVMALTKALEALTRPCNVIVISDSEYVCNSVRQWLDGWHRKRYVKVKHADLWARIYEATQKHKVRTQWTKGHAGSFYNERCDDLAGEARRMLKSIVDEMHVSGDVTKAEEAISRLPFPVEGEVVPTRPQMSLV